MKDICTEISLDLLILRHLTCIEIIRQKVTQFSLSVEHKGKMFAECGALNTVATTSYYVFL